MKTVDSSELYAFFRNFRFALNGDTGADNFMLRQRKAYQVYEAAVAHIDNATGRANSPHASQELVDEALWFGNQLTLRGLAGRTDFAALWEIYQMGKEAAS